MTLVNSCTHVSYIDICASFGYSSPTNRGRLMIDEGRLYQTLGERLRALREQQDDSRGRLTQAALAKQVGLERTSITNIEKGAQKVPLHVLFRICETLRVPVAEVLPALSEVQAAKQESLDEEVDFVGEQVVKAPPLTKMAIANLLSNLEHQDHHGTTHQ